MLIQVIDANGVAQTIAALAPGTPIDRSGAIASATASQVLMPENVDGRSGWLLYNPGPATLVVNELGGDAHTDGGWSLAPGQSFPPPNCAVVQGAVSIAGPIGALFQAREW